MIRLYDAKLGEFGDVEKHLLKQDTLFDKFQNAVLDLEDKLKIAVVLRSMPESYLLPASALEARSDDDITMEQASSMPMDEYHNQLKRSGKSSPKEQVLKAHKRARRKLLFL